VELATGEQIRASRVVLAVGHSARDTYDSLHATGVAMVPKPFALGFRIEHPQALINEIQYGSLDAQEVQRGKGRCGARADVWAPGRLERGGGPLRRPCCLGRALPCTSRLSRIWCCCPCRIPVADYSLATTFDAGYLPQPSGAREVLAAAESVGTSGSGGGGEEQRAQGEAGGSGREWRGGESWQQQPGSGGSKRGVFSFCMCPGGQVVPTSTSPEELCVNGMSFSKR
jgi:hypothetical protein